MSLVVQKSRKSPNRFLELEQMKTFSLAIIAVVVKLSRTVSVDKPHYFERDVSGS